jgi:pyruvate dehydrogenase E2 component (dihydrolipoamide acetyltransferase)
VEKLVLVSSAGMGRQVNAAFGVLSVPFLSRLVAGSTSAEGIEKILKMMFYDPAIGTPGMVAATVELAKLPGATEALLSATRAGINICGQRGKYTRRLKELVQMPTPTLVVWGKQDHIIPVAHARVAAAGYLTSGCISSINAAIAPCWSARRSSTSWRWISWRIILI